MADSQKNLWAPVWKGLIVDPEGKHYRRLKGALWLLVYFFLHADWDTGVVWYSAAKITQRTGFPKRTIDRWMRRLRGGGYISVEKRGRSLRIWISKWKTLRGRRHNGAHHGQIWSSRPPTWRDPRAENR